MQRSMLGKGHGGLYKAQIIGERKNRVKGKKETGIRSSLLILDDLQLGEPLALSYLWLRNNEVWSHREGGGPDNFTISRAFQCANIHPRV